MFEIFGAVGLVAFAVSSVAVGLRCIRRGLASGALPELSVGVGFLVGVLVGYVPESLATSTDWFTPTQSDAILAVTQVAIRVAAVAVMVFTLSVFGRRGGLGWGLFGVLSLALVASWVAFPHYVDRAATPADAFWYEVFSVARSLAVAWGAVESLVYYRMAARRASLGLSDPVVTNRFLLWGIGLAALTVLMASTTLAKGLGVDPTAYAWLLFESLMGLVGAVGLWLAFFPPRGYLEHLRRQRTSSVA